MAKRKILALLSSAAAGLAVIGAGPASAQGYMPNGSGADPDGDSNPAVNTRLIARIGDAAEAALDPPFRVITFETPPGRHGDQIRQQYAKEFGVTFGGGLRRQICDGPRYFRYDSECTYLRAPSGQFAALHKDEWGRPLRIDFVQPVCAAALALYPTGGAEGETYRVTLRPYAEDGSALERVQFHFDWTQDTFRWRLMTGAFFLDRKAARVEVDIQSRDDRKKPVRFLVDDVAFIESGCEIVLDDILKENSGPVASLSAE